ncbi:UNVERIFIED_CONTAM: Transcription factor [Sesamum radiatum]|uniref:Transcription factor n=1 Tax=Sesamum radiatum TaxID=300843 RepID=A0AAW2LPV9_SESRA
MAEDFQGGVCGGNWWNPPRNLFGSSPCASAINDMGSFGWLQNHDLMMDVSTARSISDDSAGSAASDGANSVLIQDVQKPQQPTGDGNMPMFASTTDDWNQDLLHDHSGRSEDDYSRMLQEAAGLNYQQTTTDVVDDCPDQNHKNWSAKNFCEDSSINPFKQVIDQSFALEQQPSNSLTSSTQCLPTDSQGLSTTFPLMNSASYSYSTSSLLQTLFDTDSDQPHEQSLLDNQATNYSSYPNHQMNSTEFLPSLTKAPTTSKPSLAKQQPASHLPITNNTTFWNAMAAASERFQNFQHHKEEDHKDLASAVKKFSSEPSFKRPRIETPSPLPTFKVRKEKLGDRITALQQLVSPFGKTDTASVLHEAIEYIKFLHDQVSVLSTPYLKNATPPLQRCPKAGDKNKDLEGPIQDLKSRGLSLVPISSTFPVAAETTADFWTPTFGGSFR